MTMLSGPHSNLRRETLLLLAVGVGFVGGCGTEPGSLIINLGSYPELTNQDSVTITGQIERDPPTNTPVVVRLTGAATATDSLDSPGSFLFRVGLRLDAVNTFNLSAEDKSGSANAPVQIKIEHDGTGPRVVSTTPNGDGVSTTASIEVVFDEAVVELNAGAGLRLLRGWDSVPGTSAAIDSVTYWFVPDNPLAENAVYEIGFASFADAAGNPPEPAPAACIVTTPPGDVLTVPDSASDLWFVGDVVGTSPSDLLELRLARIGDSLAGVLEFSEPRSLDLADENNLLAYLEFDIDQDSTTGFPSIKDGFFRDTLQSGIGADYGIAIETVDIPPDTAFVAKYTGISADGDTLYFDLTHSFRPSLCETFVGFVVPVSAFETDDGAVDLVTIAVTVEFVGPVFTGALADPTPTEGHLSIDIGAIASPPPTVARGPTRRMWLRVPRGRR
ncbi:MAG TPA: Ig-like domain-containing protein [Gemmatimonadales bacterium]|jgi:hypothetical protein